MKGNVNNQCICKCITLDYYFPCWNIDNSTKLMGADEAGVEPKRPDSLAGGGNDGAGAGTVLLLSKVLPNAIGTGAGTGAADEEVSF